MLQRQINRMRQQLATYGRSYCWRRNLQIGARDQEIGDNRKRPTL